MTNTELIPSHVVLETAANCNLSCKGCAIHGPMKCVTRPVGVMKSDVWQMAIGEIGSWNKPLTLSLNGGGEPLLHPQLFEIIRVALSYPQLDVGFLTNGMLFTEKWANFSIDNQVDWIAFSVDGINPQTFSQVRHGADLAQVEANILRLLELKKKAGGQKPRVLLNMVAYDEVIAQKTAFVDKWLAKVDKVMISHYRNPPSSRRWSGSPTAERRPCPFLFSQVVIAWDGRIGLCCEDFNIDIELGRVGEGTILESWNGARMAGFRRAHQDGDFASLPLCHDCDTWADEVLMETINVEKKYKLIRRLTQDIYVLSGK